MPLLSAMTKAIRANEQLPPRGIKWLTARRSTLDIYPDRLECGDWTIANTDIRSASILRCRAYLFFKAPILRVHAGDHHYYFGLNPWVDLEPHLSFDAPIEDVAVGYSWFSLIVRALLLTYIAYWIIQRVTD